MPYANTPCPMRPVHQVVADPSYFPEMCTKRGSVVRAVAIVNEPVPNTGTPPCGSYQVIFPGQSIGRANDLYLFCCSAGHKVAPDGKYIVFVSSTVEGPTDGMSAEAVAQRELAAGLAMLKGVGTPQVTFNFNSRSPLLPFCTLLLLISAVGSLSTSQCGFFTTHTTCSRQSRTESKTRWAQADRISMAIHTYAPCSCCCSASVPLSCSVGLHHRVL